jgi:Na+-translocating ferredoxin:NAD+ oxidoreductase RNF subunit RnfB
MEAILTAVIPVVIIGILCAAMLVIASKLMAVKEDERFPAVRDCLPGANCGACGFAGCDGYAKALCENSETPANLCIPGGASVAAQLSGILGVEAGAVEKKIAAVHCNGDCSVTEDKVDYSGISSCKAAKLIFGGKGACGFGCLGLGDCAEVCPQDAICVENNLARIIGQDCIGCGMCVKTCPNHIISLVPAERHYLVACSNRDKGGVTRKVCSRGCIGCKKCEKACPSGAITVKDNVSSIDYSLCTACGACAEACPVGCILLDDGERVTIFK